jgi:CheY-like chemotaxis protein
MAGKIILVADDDADARALLQSALGLLGHDVVVVPTGQQAVDYSNKRVFDLIIVDWHMPGLNGFEVASKIWESKGLNADTKIIIFTSADTESDVALCKAHGFTALLSKGFDLNQLRVLINQVFEGQP